MDVLFSEDELAFKAEVEGFLAREYTDEIRAAYERSEGDHYRTNMMKWLLKLKAHGWLLHMWPVSQGGPDWTATQRYIFDVVFSEYGAPKTYSPNFAMVGPVIYTYGTDEQKSRFLTPMVNCETWWCQGYSEPGAGSDLASLQTRAARDGDDYVVNGTKVWTTYAQYADWMFCLVRTNTEVKKQAGISFLLIDMQTPGIEVNKISTIDGFHSLNEVVLTDVRVPIANRIGDENNGWTYAKGLLNQERTTLARVTESKRLLAKIKLHAASTSAGLGQPLIARPSFARKLAQAEIDLMALEFIELRVLASTSAGQTPGNEAAILKLRGSEVRQQMQTLLMELAGYYKGFLGGGLMASDIEHAFALGANKNYLHGRAATILGGSSEVQRNIVSKSVLGL